VLRLPKLAEQRRIAFRAMEQLDAVQGARERMARVRTILKRFRQAVLGDATSGRLTENWRPRLLPAAAPLDSGEGSPLVPDTLPVPHLPPGWSLVPLRDVARRFQYGTSVRAVDKSFKDGVTVLRMGNIQDGGIDLSRLKVIDPGATEIAPFLLSRGDILFNRTNSSELVGKAAVFDHDLEAVFASYLLRIACDERRVSSRFVCAWINSPWGRQWARAVRTDCVNQSNINASKLKTLPLPVPPRDEQDEIVRRMEALFGFAETVEHRLAAAWEAVERLPRTILERALRGELEDDPAEPGLQKRVGAEGGQAERDGAEKPRAVRLGSQRVERTRKPAGAARIVAGRGLNQESPGDQKHHATRSQSELTGAHRQAAVGLVHLSHPQPALELLRPGPEKLVNPVGDHGEPCQTDQPAAERLVEHRSGKPLVAAAPGRRRT
jgi:hypothetical protein